ncbi:hypothetical protein LCGC14_1191790 [marine sediment metagenome]|uniref:Uncharacterized protein n=1 Tax=marine sediment metagenome TaxID=412755 RepID=A0A0F9LNX6_9ZZZZ
MAKYHCTQHDTDFFKTPRMKRYAHPVVDEYGEDVIDDETGKQVWCNKPKQDMGAMEESAKAGHLVEEAKKLGGVVVSETLSKDVSIAKAVALKASVELVVGGVINLKDIGAYSKKFEAYLLGE